jgi:hypothetical protein
VAFSFDYARRLKGERTGLFVEVPFAAAPSHRGGSSHLGQQPAWPRCTLFPQYVCKPSLTGVFSPWLSAGFGYGWLQTSASLNNGAPHPEVNRNTGTAQFGGGGDIRTPIHILFPISLRAGLRDYYAVNAANYGPSLRQQGQHDIVPAGGFVIHF